jgi:hypothetical protein
MGTPKSDDTTHASNPGWVLFNTISVQYGDVGFGIIKINGEINLDR